MQQLNHMTTDDEILKKKAQTMCLFPVLGFVSLLNDVLFILLFVAKQSTLQHVGVGPFPTLARRMDVGFCGVETDQFVSDAGERSV